MGCDGLGWAGLWGGRIGNIAALSLLLHGYDIFALLAVGD